MQNDPTSRVFQNLDGFAEVEWFIDNRRRVNLDTTKGNFLLLISQETALCCRVRQIPESEEGESSCQAAFDGKEVFPRWE